MAESSRDRVDLAFAVATVIFGVWVVLDTASVVTFPPGTTNVLLFLLVVPWGVLHYRRNERVKAASKALVGLGAVLLLFRSPFFYIGSGAVVLGILGILFGQSSGTPETDRDETA